MSNVISPSKRSVTYLENRKVLEWMAEMARARKTDVSVILREATSAYYLEHKEISGEPTHFDRRTAAKSHQRLETVRKIASGELTSAEAQERNAPIHSPVRVRNLWPSIRRHVRANA